MHRVNGRWLSAAAVLRSRGKKKRTRKGSVARDEYGAGTRSRTRDLMITNQLLYQLSYAGMARFARPHSSLAMGLQRKLGAHY